MAGVRVKYVEDKCIQDSGGETRGRGDIQKTQAQMGGKN